MQNRAKYTADETSRGQQREYQPQPLRDLHLGPLRALLAHGFTV